MPVLPIALFRHLFGSLPLETLVPAPGILLLLGLLGFSSGMAPGATAADLPDQITKALRLNKLTSDNLSLYVREVTAPAPRLLHNADQPRAPASTIKLVTTIAGLGILGPSYKWSTRAYVTGPVVDGRLDGDLVIKGFGDPSLRPEDFWRFVWEIRAHGLVTIGGNLIIDNSFFEPPGAERGDFDGKPDRSYNALPAALSVNFQATHLQVRHAPDKNGLLVYTVPPLYGVDVINEMHAIDAPCRAKHHKPTVRIGPEKPIPVVRLTGSFSTKCRETAYARLLMSPETHAASAFLALWKEMGGTIEGRVRAGVKPADADLLHRQDSRTLAEVIRDINKWSNNLMTRTLLLTLGAERKGAPGSPAKGRSAIADWLAEQGLDLPGLVLDNGSGLSRDTRISAAGMGQLLSHVYSDPTMSELLSSLSVMGVDGTAHKRFRKHPLRGRAHVKTGTLRGATGIAGFVLDRQDRRWIVVSLINKPTMWSGGGKSVEDALLRWIYDGAGK